MYCIALVTAPAVYSALFVIARTMAFLGLQLPFMTSPAVYAVAALTAMVSPLFIPMLFLALPVSADSPEGTLGLSKIPFRGWARAGEIRCSLNALLQVPLGLSKIPFRGWARAGEYNSA